MRESVPIYNYPKASSDEQILTSALTQAMYSYLKEIMSAFYNLETRMVDSGSTADFYIRMYKYYHLFPFVVEIDRCVDIAEDGTKVFVDTGEKIQVYGYAMFLTPTDENTNMEELEKTVASLKKKITQVLLESMPCDVFGALSEQGSELKQRLDKIVEDLVLINKNSLLRLAKKYIHYFVPATT